MSTYRPPWRNDARQSVRGPDEDATTMAIQAAASVVESAAAGVALHRLLVVTREPALLDGPTEAVIRIALGLREDVAIEMHLGGGPAVLAAVAGATAGTLVIGVQPEAPAAAAAALVGCSGANLLIVRRVDGHLPARVRAPGAPALVSDDARLLRDAGWKPALAHAEVDGTAAAAVVGVPAAIASALGAPAELTEAVGAHGAAAPLLALAELAASGTDGAIVAVEGASMASATVADVAVISVLRDEPAACDLPEEQAADTASPPIPASAAAYTRAFAAKVGFAGGRCQCGALELPPRSFCLTCGRSDAFELERLPRAGTVYTAVTIHAPVPGKTVPYSLVIIDLDDVDVRHLAPVTGVPAGSVTIGDRGRLVLRRLADREVGPDYGWAFALPPAAVAT